MISGTPPSFEQALKTSLQELVQSYIRDDSRLKRISFVNIKNLADRLVEIGIELYAPTIMMLFESRTSFKNNELLSSIGIEYIDDFFHKIVRNKIDYFCFATEKIKFFSDLHFINNDIIYKFSKSDPHNCGKETLFFDIVTNTNSIKKFVFKPSCYTSQELINIFINESSCSSCETQKILFKNSKYFHIKEYIHSSKNILKIEQFLYNLGVIIAVSQYTRATDLNYENIISSYCSPIIIDAKFILDDFKFTLCYTNKYTDERKF